METVTFSVPTNDCEGCARSIKSSLSGARGVRQVNVDVPNKRVSVEFDPAQTTPDAVNDELEQAGFPPETRIEERQMPAREGATPPTGTRPALRYWLLAFGVALLALAGYIGYEVYPRFGLPP